MRRVNGRMQTSRYHNWAIVATFLLVWMLSESREENRCQPGWFGTQCQYKCHCESKTCGEDGSCPGGVCERGWFGPECQYLDLAISEATADIPEWLIDNSDVTCNTNTTLEQLTVKLYSTFIFTWLKLVVKDPALLLQIQLNFLTEKDENLVSCKNMTNVKVNNKTLNIHCDLDVIVQYVNLTGDGVKSLCSLYISGGRNVAIRQKTNQSSTQLIRFSERIKFSADRAVDGSRSVDMKSHSCAGTKRNDRKSTWNVTLGRACTINRYMIINPPFYGHSLKGFSLKSFTKDGRMVFNYIDTERKSYLLLKINSVPGIAPVSVVSISNRYFIVLCEVELYGDSVCESSMYGRDCEHTCNCAVRNEACLVSSGGCPSGCAAGYHGENCKQACDFGKYGDGCRFNCSQFCSPMEDPSSSPCNHINGMCHKGCKVGYKTSKCEDMCEFGKYGDGCRFNCSQFCSPMDYPSSSPCSHINGMCHKGCKVGYKTSKCEDICEFGKYGDGCRFNCSQFCSPMDDPCSSPCSHINGTCYNGCNAGYKTPKCENDCDFRKYGDGCSSDCSQFCKVTDNTSSPCHNVNGTCLNGCQIGYLSPMCEKKTPVKVPNAGVSFSDFVLTISGGIAATLLTLAAVGAYIYREKPTLQEPRLNKSHTSTIASTREDDLVIVDDYGTSV